MPLPKRDRKVEAAKRTIREAFEDLERAVSPADSRDFGSATLESVQQAALDIENQLGSRSSLRNMRRLMPLFSGLQYYSAAIEVLCNGTPYLPWIWAPIKLILKVASDYVEAIEQIIKAYSRIGESLNRFRILDATFGQNANFQQTLAIFYADIVRFHKQAYTLVRRSCWKVLFLTSWGRFQRRFDNIIDDLKRHEDQIDREANAYHIAEARDTRDKLEAWRQDALAKLARDEEEQSARHLQTISTWLKLDNTDQVAIFDKLSTEGTKYPETCGWVLKNSTMVSWLKPKPDPPFVWLQGNPGTGKSTIVGKLATFLRVSPKSLVVTHFCTSSYASSTQYDKILRSLLFQLVSANDDLIAHIYWEYVVCKKMASVTALEQLMATVVTTLLGEPGQSQPIHVFLDGLEEIEAEKQRQVINLMRKVVRGAKANGAIFKVLISLLSLSDEKECLEEAIWTYASHRLTSDAHRLSQLGLGGSDLTNLRRSIARKADGMFLWARLVLDCLATNIFHNRHEITAAIDTLPRELSEFYERVLTNTIANFDPRSVDRMRQILGWIAFAKRPLRQSEFRSALAFSAGDSEVDALVPSYIFDIYLLTPQSKLLIAEDKVMREHCIACVTCLLSGLKVFQPYYPHSARYLRVLKGLHGFHVYANEYWVDYILSIVTSPDTLNQPDLLSLVVNDLSKNLENIGESFNAFDKKDDSTPSENGLGYLKMHKGLYASAIATLELRSKKGFGDEFGEERSTAGLEEVKELRDALANYQATIKSLLLIQDFPGVAPEELELFKREFRTSAYTCRLLSCPRATAGFDTSELRLEHEATHTQRLQCLYPGCQYPPFTSTRALKSHEMKCHETALGRKTIRRVAAWPQNHPEGNRQAERAHKQADTAQKQAADVQTQAEGGQNASAQINDTILQILTNQTGRLSGWQADVLIQERVSRIFNS
ncbi:NACHT domain protein [Stipitochalara longipes BDJ]|nr:NACHT domain protein [Stipitochalara longipes BDJ]